MPSRQNSQLLVIEEEEEEKEEEEKKEEEEEEEEIVVVRGEDLVEQKEMAKVLDQLLLRKIKHQHLVIMKTLMPKGRTKNSP